MPKPSMGEKPRMRFRQLAGAHIAADLTADQVPVVDKDGNETGKFTYPKKQYVAGDIIVSEVDLVEKCGANKFQLIGEMPQQMRQRRVMNPNEAIPSDPAQGVLEKNPPKAPHGQVSSGFQEAVQTNEDVTGQEFLGVTGTGLSDKGAEVLREAKEKDAATQQQNEAANKSTAETDMNAAREKAGTEDKPKGTARSKRQLPQNLNSMNLRDLRQYAEAEEIDLKGVTTRDDVIRTIREAH